MPFLMRSRCGRCSPQYRPPAERSPRRALFRRPCRRSPGREEFRDVSRLSPASRVAAEMEQPHALALTFDHETSGRPLSSVSKKLSDPAWELTFVALVVD